MRRKIAKQREKDVYKQAQLRKDFIEAVTIGGAIMLIVLTLAGIVYFIGSSQGKW